MPRRPPTASSSSMKMIAGSCLRAIANRRRMRAAPRPANISTNEAADWAKNCAPDSCATALASSVLPVPGRPVQQDALRHLRAELLELLRVAQELDDLLQLGLGLVDAGDVRRTTTDWLEAGLICCGLTRGITFSVRHIRKISADEEQDHHDRLPVVGPVLDFLHERRVRRTSASRRRVHGRAPGRASRSASRGAAARSCGAVARRAARRRSASPAGAMPWHRRACGSRHLARSADPASPRLRALGRAASGGRSAEHAQREVAEELRREAPGRARRCARRRRGSAARSPAATGGGGGRSRRPRTRGRPRGSGASR